MLLVRCIIFVESGLFSLYLWSLSHNTESARYSSSFISFRNTGAAPFCAMMSQWFLLSPDLCVKLSEVLRPLREACRGNTCGAAERPPQQSLLLRALLCSSTDLCRKTMSAKGGEGSRDCWQKEEG